MEGLDGHLNSTGWFALCIIPAMWRYEAGESKKPVMWRLQVEEAGDVAVTGRRSR